jgi:hypothetical protein
MMTEQAADQPVEAQRADDPQRRGRGLALGWIGLLLLIGASVLVGPGVGAAALALANPDHRAADAVDATFATLPQPSLVLVAMDADLGTYPEIRPATHAVLADLLSRGAGIAFVSVSIEGRALAVAEMDRLRGTGVADDRLLDLGFVSGAEAGMVRLVDGALRPGMRGSMAALISQRGGGIGAFDSIVVVGGGDIGPRSWVEQVGTRLPSVPMVAIAPTFAQPELTPYLRSGQLAALLATTRDDAAYVEQVGASAPEDRPPGALAMLVGMLVALVVLGRQVLGGLPRLASGASVAQELDE